MEMDTVDMQGKGFTCFVKIGEQVTLGQKLLKFSFADIQAAGHPATTAVILCNSDEVGEPADIHFGETETGNILMEVQ